MNRVEKLAWNYDPTRPGEFHMLGGYEWNEYVCPDYQRHFPEVIRV